MIIEGASYRTIWPSKKDNSVIRTINQNFLPYSLIIGELKKVDDVVQAIKEMRVRGAGLLGATAGYGMYLAALEAPKDNFDGYLIKSAEKIRGTRPTAVNLSSALERQLKKISKGKTIDEKIDISFKTANNIADEDAKYCKRIGQHGLKKIREKTESKNGEVVNILTHCNAGALAFVDYGTALAPIYDAFDNGIKVHVWVDETRPRNQGARLTAWELGQHGVPYTIIPDNVGGHLMQKGKVDLVMVGADRVAKNGDAANKIGTYLKALAAYDNNIPFYVALPSTTFDFNLEDGSQIPIEERNGEEVKYIEGLGNGEIKRVLLTPENSRAVNYGFDVTPARLITGLITEKGICKASKEGIEELFPEKFR